MTQFSGFLPLPCWITLAISGALSWKSLKNIAEIELSD